MNTEVASPGYRGSRASWEPPQTKPPRLWKAESPVQAILAGLFCFSGVLTLGLPCLFVYGLYSGIPWALLVGYSCQNDLSG